MVSSTVLAWWMTGVAAAAAPDAANAHRYVPMINIPRAQFDYRKDCVAAFAQCGIQSANMVFADDISKFYSPLTQTRDFGVILTDHNQLADAQAPFATVVKGIVDHHKDEKLYLTTSAQNRILETCGSCCSLVTRIILSQTPTLLSTDDTAPIAQLLASVIEIDTSNFSDEAKKTTPVDVAAIQFLYKSIAQQRYKRLLSLKNDISSLRADQILLKDAKFWHINGKYRLQISTIPISFEQFDAHDPHWRVHAVETFRTPIKPGEATAPIDALIILSAHRKKQNGFGRDAMIIVPNALPPPILADKTRDSAAAAPNKVSSTQMFDALTSGFEQSSFNLNALNDETNKVDWSNKTTTPVLVRKYSQVNVEMSRKQVGPLVEQIVSRL